MSNFASNIRYLRGKMGWSQQRMANKLQMNKSSYQRLEEEECEPRLYKLIALAKVHGMTIDDLVFKPLIADATEWTESEREA